MRCIELMDACYCCYSDKNVKDGSVSINVRSNNGSTSSSSIISDSNVKPGPLLKYFKSFNCTSVLSSHRVILLGGLWCQKACFTFCVIIYCSNLLTSFFFSLA